MPLMLVHGWPGSIVEFLDVIGPLTDPAAHGGDPRMRSTWSCPRSPGSGGRRRWSARGGTADRVAGAFVELMARLGYDRYGVQGGDYGAIVTPAMGRVAPDAVAGVHVNAATGGFVTFAPPSGRGPRRDDRRREGPAGAPRRTTRRTQMGYMQIQSTRPQTLAHGLVDSPAGQLAWIVEKFKEWTGNDTAGLPEDAVDRDHMLTNVMFYWLTGTAGSSADMYYEGAHDAGGGWGAEIERSPVPTGVAVFPQDIAIRRYAELSNTITRWTEFDEGGHFAAMEQPDLLVGDVREFFRTLR